MAFGRKISPEESLTRQLADGGRDFAPAKPEAKGKLEAVSERFEIRVPRHRLSELVLPESVRGEFLKLKSRIQNHELIYGEWGFRKIDPRSANTAVNFYGPPGTGKTMCADALAADLGLNILEVNYAEIESKYVGETAKNIVAAFDQARQSGALLFFDEADSILGRRMTNVTQAADHGVNVSRAVMLKQLDSFDGVVVFATNLERNFDDAFKRRILQHVLVPLPDESGRLQLWQRMVGENVPGRGAIDYAALARESEGLSGGLIKNAVLLALCELAAREAAQKIIDQALLQGALTAVRRAEQAVGQTTGQPHITWSELKELPK